MFYTFVQNNPGGSFDIDKEAGISLYVVVEASSEEDAIVKALQIGIYFNGVDNEVDYECCGDRWSIYNVDQSDTPTIYKEPVEGRVDPLCWRWANNSPFIAVHYLNGELKWFGKDKETVE